MTGNMIEIHKVIHVIIDLDMCKHFLFLFFDIKQSH
jgi:hypothetical protein